jgi:hypothetical protein
MRFIPYIILTLAFILSSCEKIGNETDPAKIILGKWEIIEMGNWPNMEPIDKPTGFKEYLPDSVLREYDYSKQDYTFNKKYWIDSLLHECAYLQEENRYVTIGRYSFEFFDKNKKLRLDYSNIYALYNTFIWKRKK